MKTKHTPGPWRKVGTYIEPVNGGPILARAIGMKAKTPEQENKIWGEAEANARLIASAPELLEICKQQHEAIDRLFAMLIEKGDFYPSKSGQPWEACRKGTTIIAEAQGDK